MQTNEADGEEEDEDSAPKVVLPKKKKTLWKKMKKAAGKMGGKASKAVPMLEKVSEQKRAMSPIASTSLLNFTSPSFDPITFLRKVGLVDLKLYYCISLEIKFLLFNNVCIHTTSTFVTN